MVLHKHNQVSSIMIREFNVQNLMFNVKEIENIKVRCNYEDMNKYAKIHQKYNNNQQQQQLRKHEIVCNYEDMNKYAKLH